MQAIGVLFVQSGSRDRDTEMTISEKTALIIKTANEKHITIGTAESCTAGLLSSSIVNNPGASAVFYGGVVSYDNSVKMNVLGVKKETLSDFGAVSCETAKEMAEGARNVLGVDIAVSVTGIAGPGGGTPEKPVGTVCFAVSSESETTTVKKNFPPSLSRGEIRECSVNFAADLLLDTVTEKLKA